MPSERSRYSRSKPRKRPPAYSRPGTGEDLPARRPGTKVSEDSYARKVMQSTRATQARRTRGVRPFSVNPLPTGRPGQTTARPWRRGNPPLSRRGPGRAPYMSPGRWPFSHDVRGKPTRDEPWPL